MVLQGHLETVFGIDSGLAFPFLPIVSCEEPWEAMCEGSELWMWQAWVHILPLAYHAHG